MNVVLLFDAIALTPAAAADERGVLASVDAVEKVLCDVGHVCTRVGVSAGLSWLDDVRAASPALVFNLCEGVGGLTAFEPTVAAALELSGIPFTGASGECLRLSHRKDAATALLAGASLPVPISRPVWIDSEDGSLLSQTKSLLEEWSHYPAIVKPAAEDASVGITQKSVVRDARELTLAVNAASRHAPLLVQEMLMGRELNVGIVGDAVLPISEILFSGASLWPIVDYAAKWSPGSEEDRATTPECPARVPSEMARSARSLALTAWQLLGGRGYGRIDLRANSAGELHILEVNPNPDLSPHAGLARMAHEHGWSYAQLIQHIVDEALP